MWEVLKFAFKRWRYGTHHFLIERNSDSPNIALIMKDQGVVDDLHWIPADEFVDWLTESGITFYHVFEGRASSGYDIVAEPKTTVAIKLRWG